MLGLCVCPEVPHQCCSELLLLAPHLAGPVEVATELPSSLSRHHVKEVPHEYLMRGHVSTQGGGGREGRGGGRGREGEEMEGGRVRRKGKNNQLNTSCYGIVER